MKKYFNVSFQYSESVYCANIAHAESAADVERKYSRYEWVSVSEASEYDVEEARRRGKPIVEVEPAPQQEEAQQEEAQQEEAQQEEAQQGATVIDCGGIYAAIIAELEARTDRSAWNKGVTLYAVELVEELKEAAAYNKRNPEPGAECREWMLNGAQNWEQYSYGGSALIYDGDIAERLCTPSELKKTRNGERRPNSREEWLDVQARALYQACNRVARLYRQIVKEG